MRSVISIHPTVWRRVVGPVTNAFSKKFENHMHMVALYTVWYNFVKQHKTLKGISPAMASGLSETLWSTTDLAEMVDAAAPKPGPRGSYKKGAAIAA